MSMLELQAKIENELFGELEKLAQSCCSNPIIN